MGTFCLEVESIQESPRDFRLESDVEWWRGARDTLREREVELRRPFALALTAHRIGRRILCRGDLTGAVHLICGRCLEPYPYEFSEPMHLLLEPGRVSPGAEATGIKLDPDDLEVGSYTGDLLDFSPILIEILALAWPVQPRCDDACMGLCAHCGRNRNVEPCACATDAPSGPFAGLREMLEQQAARTGRQRE